VKLEPSVKVTGPPPPARVLIWSRLGNDRPCALAAAYLIKCWGMSLDKALSSMQIVRGGLQISDPYLQALRSWEASYAIGIFVLLYMLCIPSHEYFSRIHSILNLCRSGLFRISMEIVTHCHVVIFIK
jgi:hypothetical protein